MRVLKMGDVPNVISLVESKRIKGMFLSGPHPVDVKSAVLEKLGEDQVAQVLPEDIEDIEALDKLMIENKSKIIMIDATTTAGSNLRTMSLAQINLMILVDEHDHGAILVGPQCKVTTRVESRVTLVSIT